MMQLAIVCGLAVVILGGVCCVLTRMCWAYHQCMIEHANQLQNDLLHFTNASRSKVGAELESQKLTIEERRLELEQERLRHQPVSRQQPPREVFSQRVVGATNGVGEVEV